MPLKMVPFGTRGKLFISPMPFSVYDPEHTLLGEYREHDITRVVCLAPEEECRHKTGVDLFAVAREQGARRPWAG